MTVRVSWLEVDDGIVTASIAATGSVVYAGTASIGATVLALPTIAATVSAAGGVSYSGTVAMAATVVPLLPVVQASIAALGGVVYAGTVAMWVGEGATVWPTGPSGSQAAVVPRAYLRALVPIHGDDMQPIKTFELHADDREIYELDFDRLYLSTARDTAATLEAISAPAGLTVTPEVTVGGALTSGVVRFAVAQTGGPGSYDVAARISTAAGRKKTGVVTVVVP